MVFDYNMKLPILDIGNRIGMTEYIDFIPWNEVTEPVMKGFDIYKRCFIVIKFLVNEDKKPHKIMQTFFERYTYNTNLWMGCGHCSKNLLFTDGGMTQKQFEFIEEILKGKTMTIEEGINSCFKIGSTVKLLNEKEWDAAEIIQKYWRLCRYDPTYTMCKKIQTRNLENILNN